jgi:hypothetical protein
MNANTTQKIRKQAITAALAAALFLVFNLSAALAAVNTVTGTVAGAALTAATFNLSSYDPATDVTIVKTAFLASDGSALSDGAGLPAGTQVQFLIYINNTNAFTVYDVNLQDALNAADFVYSANTVRFATIASAGFTAAGLRSQIITDDTGTDGADGDVVSAAANTVSAGDIVGGNGQLDIPANTAWGMLFTVTLQ